MIKTVLFDLDGTLVPMDQDIFIKAYFKGLATKLAPYGYEPQNLIDSIWKSTAYMIKNDGNQPNEIVFWKAFSEIFGEKVYGEKHIFEDFYQNNFDDIKAVCGFNEKAKQVIDYLKSKSIDRVIASNPLFPKIAQEKRIRWAGIEPNDFIYLTSYENSNYCKPNPLYYKEILDKLGLDASTCLMVGNDVTEDMVARMVGLDVFLITDCMINKNNIDIAQFKHGNFDDLMEYLTSVITNE